MPCDYSKYSSDWKQIRTRILERAEHRCEECHVPNYAWIWRDSYGNWHDAGEQTLREAGHEKTPFTIACTFADGRVGQIIVIRIILTVAHLDHNIDNNADNNLKAFCQWHHLRHDKDHHARNAATTRWRKKSEGQGELFP